MPVHQFDPEDGGNYWGYMPLNFFAPHHAYASAADGRRPPRRVPRDGARRCTRPASRSILDVVYNHTSESGDDGPDLLLSRHRQQHLLPARTTGGVYRNDAGTGNVLRTAHPAVRRLVIDSLRFWTQRDARRRLPLRPGVDLHAHATTDRSTSDDPPIISEISADPDFADVRLIAEAWDLGAYQLGRAFPGITWAQWNGKFRDDVRAFVEERCRPRRRR